MNIGLVFVSCLVARIEKNVLINAEHREFPKVATSLHQPIWWDKRLFAA